MAQMKAIKRTALGTRKTQRLRAEGLTPGIIYGHGQDNVPVALDRHDLDVAVDHGQRVLELDVDGAHETVLLKDVQYDTFGQVILHVDLARVELHERVEITVPVVLRGTPAGASHDGVLQQSTNEVTIECVVTAIPEEIRAQVNDLNVGDSLQARDLELPEGATLVTDGETVICSVVVIAEEEAAPAPAEVAEAAQPEVIGEDKEPQPEEGQTSGGE